MLSLEQGEKLVKIARKSIEFFSVTRRIVTDLNDEKEFQNLFPVFIAIKNQPSNSIRGGIALLNPSIPLWNAVIQTAINAAFKDPRFSEIKSNELNKVVIEVSILTTPEELHGDRKGFPNQLIAGIDGLIIEKGSKKVLTLPSEALELNLDSKKLLELTCRKANLLSTAWFESRTTVYKFQMQTFKEIQPKGQVIEVTQN